MNRKPSDGKEGNQQVVLMRKGSPIQVAEAHQTEHQQPIEKKEETTMTT
jgi:hypothetical protein